MNDTTLVFLIKRTAGKISEVCLGMKKRRFGTGRWNGIGGKLLPGETIEPALIREAKEEISVDVKDLSKVAELVFYYLHKPEWDQKVHVFLCEEWEGEPVESEEMIPKWFAVKDIPFKDMWPDDSYWLPLVLNGELVKGTFTFTDGNTIQKHSVEAVKSL